MINRFSFAIGRRPTSGLKNPAENQCFRIFCLGQANLSAFHFSFFIEHTISTTERWLENEEKNGRNEKSVAPMTAIHKSNQLHFEAQVILVVLQQT